jgi:probable HAF family extracellular repeat protein
MKALSTALLRPIILGIAASALPPAQAQGPLTSSAPAQRYSISDIGSLSTDPTHGVRALDINNRGHVHGENDLPAPAGQGKINAYSWNGHVQERIYPLAPALSFGGSINDAGQCVGYSTTAIGDLHAYFWNSGVTQDVHVGPLSFSKATDINVDALLCGTYSIFLPGYIVSQFRPYVGDVQGNWLDVGTFGGGGGFAYAISDHMRVVGIAKDASESMQPFLWDPSTGMQDLGGLGGLTTPRDLDNFDRVVGMSANPAGEYRAFLWQAGGMIELATLGGSAGDAKAINDHGVAVGNSTDAGGVQHATLWPTGATGPVKLQDAIRPGTPWVLTGASGINELGEICGTGTVNGVQRAYRLTPLVRGNRLSGARPGISGRVNTLHGLGFEPGATISVAHGLALGRTAAPGCAGQFYSIQNAQILLNTVADGDGRIAVTFNLPSNLAGTQILVQALDRGYCIMGEVRSQLLQ